MYKLYTVMFNNTIFYDVNIKLVEKRKQLCYI
jgi:hypothetical protein